MKKGTPQSALIPKNILYVTVVRFRKSYVTLVSDTVYHEDHVPP